MLKDIYYVTEPVFGKTVEVTSITTLSDFIWGLNSTLEAKGFLRVRDYKDIASNILGIRSADDKDIDGFILISQPNEEEDVFYHSEFDGTFCEEEGAWKTYVKVLYHSPDYADVVISALNLKGEA